jgi:hypothetical protein
MKRDEIKKGGTAIDSIQHATSAVLHRKGSQRL